MSSLKKSTSILTPLEQGLKQHTPNKHVFTPSLFFKGLNDLVKSDQNLEPATLPKT